jgi:hypothetical protein
MGTTWRHLPEPARVIAVAASDAVTAAGDRDRDRFGAATTALAAADGSPLVLGAVVRLLLEELHPDGLNGTDIRRVIEDCARDAGWWGPGVDPHVLLVLLAGSLGIHDVGGHDVGGHDLRGQNRGRHDRAADEPSPHALAGHAAQLVAALLARTKRPLAGYLTVAFAEIERTEHFD